MSNLKELTQQLEEKQTTVKEKRDMLSNMENDPLYYFEDEATELFNESLEELYGDVVNQLPIYIKSVSALFIDNDPTAYRMMLNDYCDGLNASGFDGYRELLDEIEDLEAEIFDLESEIEDIQIDSEQ